MLLDAGKRAFEACGLPPALPLSGMDAQSWASGAGRAHGCLQKGQLVLPINNSLLFVCFLFQAKFNVNQLEQCKYLVSHAGSAVQAALSTLCWLLPFPPPMAGLGSHGWHWTGCTPSPHLPPPRRRGSSQVRAVRMPGQWAAGAPQAVCLVLPSPAPCCPPRSST